jgi:hypothetical protein
MSPLDAFLIVVLLLTALFLVVSLYYKPRQVSGFENMNSSNDYTGPQSMSGAKTTDTADQARLAVKGQRGAPTGANAGSNQDSNYPR